MPQLQINQGPQDALLYDNSRSYFTNVGYVRTSNFQMELRDVDPQNSANLGSTVQFVIPKAADLLGPVDLLVDFKQASNTAPAKTIQAWIDTVGFAMIEKMTFSVGSHDVETITGDQLNIVNELMKTDETRLGRNTIGKTGAPAYYNKIISKETQTNGTGVETYSDSGKDGSRVIGINGAKNTNPLKLIIPLGLFFTKHPSQYFPLCSIAGCNDVRIAIKFRPLNELVQIGGTQWQTVKTNNVGLLDSSEVATSHSDAVAPTFDSSNPFEKCRLRCHYVHVTGPEATTLMNKEHVRLLKLWQNNTKNFTPGSIGTTVGKLVDIDLSFLHPVQELIITIRKVSELGTDVTTTGVKPGDADQKGFTKNRFVYHGGGKDPNPDAYSNKVVQAVSTGATAAPSGAWADDTAYEVTTVRNEDAAVDEGSTSQEYLTVDNFQLTLNGQERHPSLASAGLDRKYLMDRLMPMMHSNTSTNFDGLNDRTLDPRGGALDQLAHALDRKEIYVYPFALNPEGANPSGAVNFSKVSHAKLTINGFASGTATTEYQVDVYGVHYNWLQIKDGRALTSFA